MTTSLENTATVEELRDHARELVESVAGSAEPLFITIDGQSKAALVDYELFEEYKKFQQGVALQKILDDRMDRAERDGTFVPVDEAFQRIREKILARKPS